MTPAEPTAEMDMLTRLPRDLLFNLVPCDPFDGPFEAAGPGATFVCPVLRFHPGTKTRRCYGFTTPDYGNPGLPSCRCSRARAPLGKDVSFDSVARRLPTMIRPFTYCRLLVLVRALSTAPKSSGSKRCRCFASEVPRRVGLDQTSPLFPRFACRRTAT
jgi:hypothetical protein